MERKELKARGKAAFKASYWKCVVASILLSLGAGVAAGGSGSTSGSASSAATEQMSNLSQEELVAIIVAVITASLVMIVISLVLRIFVFNPLTVGSRRFFRCNAEDQSTPLGIIKEGFSDYGRVFVSLFLRDLFLCLWSCLFVIPGIVKHYSYLLVPYILRDNPDISATEAITLSRKMMNGNKARAFVLDLSFIGWHILAGITCGILEIFWVKPYVDQTQAELYLDIKNNYAG
jgi:uncharacterized membrane protein